MKDLTVYGTPTGLRVPVCSRAPLLFLWRGPLASRISNIRGVATSKIVGCNPTPRARRNVPHLDVTLINHMSEEIDGQSGNVRRPRKARIVLKILIAQRHVRSWIYCLIRILLNTYIPVCVARRATCAYAHICGLRKSGSHAYKWRFCGNFRHRSQMWRHLNKAPFTKLGA